MDKKKSIIIDQIRKYINVDIYDEWDENSLDEWDQYDRYAWEEAEQILVLIQKTPATLEWDGDGLITLLPHKDFGFAFKLEIGFDFPWLAYSTLYIDEEPVSHHGWEKSYNSFIYLINKYSDNVALDELKESFYECERKDGESDERLFVEQLLRTIDVGFLVDITYKLLLKELAGSSWFKAGLVEDSILLTPDPGFGPRVTIRYDSEVFKIRVIGIEEWVHEEYGIDSALNKIFDLIDAEGSHGTVHRQSIYWKNISKSTFDLMQNLRDNFFRDAEEKCFLELIIREKKVPEKWYQKLSPEYEGAGIRYYKEKISEKLFKPIFYLGFSTFTILVAGFFSSIIVFIALILGKDEQVMEFWSFIGPFLTVTHLIAVGLVVLSIFEDQLHEESSDIGSVSHQLGWFMIATTCIPVGYPVGLFCFVLNKHFTHRCERELKIISGDRIVYNAWDLLGYIPLVRMWIPSILFGTIGAAYWYNLPYIYKWILS